MENTINYIDRCQNPCFAIYMERAKPGKVLDNQEAVYLKDQKRILILQYGIVILLLFFAIAGAVTIVLFYQSLQQFRDEQAKFRNEQRKREELTEEQLDGITAELSLVKEGIAEIQETLAVELGAIGRLGDQGRGGEIIGMIAEKISYDYTQRALQYFIEENYTNAYVTFTRALRYQQGNSTLQFYQIYSLYLGNRNTRLTDSEFAIIESGIREINNKGFREQEHLVYTAEEMQKRIEEMEYNIEALRQQTER